MPASLHRILYVEDEPDIRTVAQMALQAVGGFAVIACASGQEALDAAPHAQADLLLLDIMMPNIDGLEACRRLKANQKLADVPVIFISAKNEDEYEEYGFSVGASDFIHKPINAPILLARVNTHLKIKLVMDYLRNENVRLQDSKKPSSSELIKVIKMLWDNPFIKF